MKTMQTLALAVLLALILSAHTSAQFISIPVIGEETGKAIEGNPGMVITASNAETGEPFAFDGIPTISRPSRIRLDISLFNLAVRPEADATLGVVIGTSGCISEDEWRARAAAKNSYGEMTRGELRQAHLGVIDFPGRWITAIRTGRVDFREQKAGQNGPLMFTAFLDRKDQRPGINTFIIRIHGIMEVRSKRILILAKDGKSIFGTYDEPWLVNVEKPACAEIPETNEYQPPADYNPTPVPTPAEPASISIKFNLEDGEVINRNSRVAVSFEPNLPSGSTVESAVYFNGRWNPWRRATSPPSGRGTFASPGINAGPCALAVRVVDANGQELGMSQLNLTLMEDNR